MSQNQTENMGFFYIDGIPTKGHWISLEDIGRADPWDYIKDELADKGLLQRDEEGEVTYGGDILCACTEGELAKHFLSSHDTFDLEGFKECFEASGDEDAKAAYLECFDDWDSQQFEDRFHGEFKSWEDMAAEYLEATGELQQIPENLRNYFDYEAYARDLRLGGDMCEHNGYFFWNH
jgi:hypothetical protein